jgi:hypothetical protein
MEELLTEETVDILFEADEFLKFNNDKTLPKEELIKSLNFCIYRYSLYTNKKYKPAKTDKSHLYDTLLFINDFYFEINGEWVSQIYIQDGKNAYIRFHDAGEEEERKIVNFIDLDREILLLIYEQFIINFNKINNGKTI